MVSIKTKISKINMEIKHFRTTKYLKITTILKSGKRGAASYNCLVISTRYVNDAELRNSVLHSALF